MHSKLNTMLDDVFACKKRCVATNTDIESSCHSLSVICFGAKLLVGTTSENVRLQTRQFISSSDWRFRNPWRNILWLRMSILVNRLEIIFHQHLFCCITRIDRKIFLLQNIDLIFSCRWIKTGLICTERSPGWRCVSLGPAFFPADRILWNLLLQRISIRIVIVVINLLNTWREVEWIRLRMPFSLLVIQIIWVLLTEW